MTRLVPADSPEFPTKLIWKNIHGRRMFYPEEQSVNKRANKMFYDIILILILAK